MHTPLWLPARGGTGPRTQQCPPMQKSGARRSRWRSADGPGGYTRRIRTAPRFVAANSAAVSTWQKDISPRRSRYSHRPLRLPGRPMGDGKCRGKASKRARPGYSCIQSAAVGTGRAPRAPFKFPQPVPRRMQTAGAALSGRKICLLSMQMQTDDRPWSPDVAGQVPS